MFRQETSSCLKRKCERKKEKKRKRKTIYENVHAVAKRKILQLTRF